LSREQKMPAAQVFAVAFAVALAVALLFCLSFPQGNLLLSFPPRIEHHRRTMQNTPEKAHKSAV